MQINNTKRPWIKAKSYNRKSVDPYYQTSAWKTKVNQVWLRDKGICQMCLLKGIIHTLIRGTKDINLQGTVDHKQQRKKEGTDDLDNLWLIGSNHHYSKSAEEGNKMK